MKKALSLLFIVSSFTLLGCQKGTVSYKSVDNLNEYYTDDKVASAMFNLTSLDKLKVSFSRDYASLFYEYKLELDTNYAYKRSSISLAILTNVSKELYIGDENIDNCRFYEVVKGESKLYAGEEAVELYQAITAEPYYMLSSSIEDNFYPLKEFITSGEKTYYVGSDKTLKVQIQNETDKGYVIYDQETLLIKKVHAQYEVENLYCTLDYKFTYPDKITHKTPNDIDFEQE